MTDPRFLCRAALLAFLIAGLVPLAGLTGCGGSHEHHAGDTHHDTGKIPITTASTEAREAYLQGRDLAEKIRATDARPYYQKAVAADADFAMAHLGLANTSTNAGDFFASLERAAELSDKASEGERWMILAAKAGAESDPDTQKDLLTRLVATFEGDERAHNLLAAYHFGRQDYDDAITHFNHAVDIDPEFSPPYNNLGYLYRALGDYDEAEKSFVRYIELLPGEANPFDSYAELLMKAGRFEESIENYRKALELQPDFIASYVGIGNNQIFMGNGDEARQTLAELHDIARNDGERRQAMFWTAVSHVHEGHFDSALKEAWKRYEVVAAKEDWATVSGDLGLIGNLQIEAGDPRAARESWAKSIEAIERASVSEEVKEAARRNHLYRQTRAALAEGGIAEAEESSSAYLEQVDLRRIPFEIRRVHELAGLIALAKDDSDASATELAQANQQDPRVLYHQAVALQKADEPEKAREVCTRAADFNQLNLNFAFVRDKAKAMLEESS